MYEFQIWASSKAEEFKKINNIGPYMTRKEDHDRFTAWLDSQVTEEIARRGVQDDFNQAV
ncbi:hypothetical protein M3637_14270 [Paenibacillus illinoisensis]|nr:hypothetical protein [Paenibacillus illinoisensis]